MIEVQGKTQEAERVVDAKLKGNKDVVKLHYVGVAWEKGITGDTEKGLGRDDLYTDTTLRLAESMWEWQERTVSNSGEQPDTEVGKSTVGMRMA